MKKKVFIVLGLFIPLFALADENVLWYDKPAVEWVEALPLGNSRLGAMVYGGVAEEELQLNEETFWGGGPHSNNSATALENLPAVRQLIFEGRNKEAQALMERTFRTKHNGMPYQTLGSLKLRFDHSGNATEYRRELDISRAVATTIYKIGETTFRREVFSSFTDDVVIVRLTADKSAAISFTAQFTSPLKEQARCRSGKTLVLSGKGQDHEGIKGVVRMETLAQALTVGGKVSMTDSTLTVSRANSVTLYISAATNFKNFRDVSGNEHKKAANILAKAIKRPYDKALASHTEFYKKQFDRVSFTLPEGEGCKKTTVERVRDFNTVGNDPSLPALMYQYGRYLLISSSQPGGQAANLQGIWNKDLRAPWDGKYTININLQMNYWPAEKTNRSETNLPLVQLVKELSEQGTVTARTMYGCRGWMAHHNTDIWRMSGEVDPVFYGGWPNGGGWLSTHLWQRWLYTGSKDYLNEVYPVLAGAARFYVDFLVRHPRLGWLVTTPSVSPEHGPGKKETSQGVAATCGCTMDNQIAFDVLTQALRAAAILNKDNGLQDTLRLTLSQLAPMQIGRYNQLQEWLDDADDPNDFPTHGARAASRDS